MHLEIRDRLIACLNKLHIDFSKSLELEIPKNESFGDLSTPLAMDLAKILKKPPKQIAELIVSNIEKDIFEGIDIAGAGFINFRLKRDFILSKLTLLLEKGEDFFTLSIGKGKKIQIEFVSANPTGPLHLGHGRGAAVGQALANILREAGYNVSTEYYINDAGRQVELLGMSVYVALQRLTGKDIQMPDDCYKGEYINELAKEIYQLYGNELIDKDFEEIGDI
ncbi:MAG: arginine--tRNA ligase, partial [Thermodesulfovibrio sp.]|nr:arginine--tRNA ligase [Thermodesulfovibrio sp.]